MAAMLSEHMADGARRRVHRGRKSAARSYPHACTLFEAGRFLLANFVPLHDWREFFTIMAKRTACIWQSSSQQITADAAVEVVVLPSLQLRGGWRSFASERIMKPFAPERKCRLSMECD
jgi:hypothetical protein